MQPRPDFGEHTYRSHGRLQGKAAIITGADSGIGRAVAVAFARGGADVVVSYLNEEPDADETVRVVEASGRRAINVPGDVRQEEHCRQIVERGLREFGRLDILVNNAAFQEPREKIEEIPPGEALDELHLPFNFGLLKAAWGAPASRALVAAHEAALPARRRAVAAPRAGGRVAQRRRPVGRPGLDARAHPSPTGCSTPSATG